MTDIESGQIAVQAARVYEEFFIPALFGAWPPQVLQAADVAVGHRVLDVACGTGILAREAVSWVGADGHVSGVDPNEGMLAIARETRAPVEWLVGYAEDLPFEAGSFDRVVSQFGLMFFADRRAAVEEMARVVASDGVVCVATWASIESTPGYAAMVELLADVFDEATAGALRAPFVLGDPAELHSLFSVVFPEVSVTQRDGVARFESIESWLHTDIRGWTLADDIDDAQYALLLQAAKRRLRQFTDDRGRVSFPAPALITTAMAG